MMTIVRMEALHAQAHGHKSFWVSHSDWGGCTNAQLLGSSGVLGTSNKEEMIVLIAYLAFSNGQVILP